MNRSKYASRKQGDPRYRCLKVRHVQGDTVTVSLYTVHGVRHVLYDLADEAFFDWRRLSITGDPNQRNGAYARIAVGRGKTYRRMRLHRLLTGCPTGLEPDHVNGNRLDNRRCNLEVVTHRENVLRYQTMRRAA